MRSYEDIVILLISVQENYEFLFNPAIEDEKKLETAASYLGICLTDFQAMYFVEQKREYLRYKYLLTEFELFLSKQELKPRKESQSRIEKDIEHFRNLADRAYHILSQNQALFSDSQTVSKYSHGISDFYKRSPHEASAQGRYEPLGTELAGTVQHGSVMVTGAKKAGVEPGFEALLHQDIVLCLDRKFRGNMVDFRACIITHKADMASIVSGALSEEVLPTYMYKGDYRCKNPSSGKVGLTTTDVKRTKTIQDALKTNKYYGEIAAKLMALAKTSESTEVNRNAVLEVLGNDIASIFMPTQRQTLIKTTYENGRLKLMPKSTLLNGHEEFGVQNENSVFAGGINNHDNYRGRKIGFATKSNISTVTDNRIINGGKLLIPLIFTGDYDKIGSSGQNLLTRLVQTNYKTGKKEYELVGIDFGHTLREPNPLIDNLLLDGRFKQPPRQVFKNFSALSDFPFSEIIKGALILVQMQEEAEKVINNYISVFEELKIKTVSTQTEYDEVKEYDEISSCLHNTKSIMSADFLKFQTKYSPYIEHIDRSPTVIDLANNLNKLCAAIKKKTSLRSPDNRHGLQHLRITDLNYDTFWAITLKQDEYILTVTLDSKETAVEALHCIGKFLIDCPVQPQINLNNNNIRIAFKVCDLEEIARALAEDNIKKQFHPEDYQAIRTAYEHLDLQDLMQAPWFKDHHLQLELTGDPSNSDAYKISLKPEEGKAFDPLFLTSLNHVFLNNDNQGPDQSIIIRFSAAERVSIYKNLLSLQDNYEFALAEVLVDKAVDPLVDELLDSAVEAYVEESTVALAIADTPNVAPTERVVVPGVSFFGNGTLSLPNPPLWEKLIVNLKEYQACLNRYTPLDWPSAQASAIAANGIQMVKDMVNYYLQPNSSAAILATTAKFIASYPSLHGSILGTTMLSELDDALQKRKGHILGLIEKGYNADFYAVEQALLQKLGDDIEGIQSFGNSLSMSSSMNI